MVDERGPVMAVGLAGGRVLARKEEARRLAIVESWAGGLDRIRALNAVLAEGERIGVTNERMARAANGFTP